MNNAQAFDQISKSLASLRMLTLRSGIAAHNVSPTIKKGRDLDYKNERVLHLERECEQRVENTTDGELHS
jgi:hypothetical protein